MKFNFPLFFLLITLSINSYSQVDFGIKKKQLFPEFIDTLNEKIFVYETPFAITYFRQSDIKELIKKPNIKSLLGNYGFSLLQDTLNANTRSIKLFNPLIYATNEQLSLMNKQTDSLTSILFNEFYYVGAYLILDGKFMLFSKDEKSIETKKLIAKKSNGLYGATYVDFWLPNKKQFYSIVTVLGD